MHHTQFFHEIKDQEVHDMVLRDPLVGLIEGSQLPKCLAKLFWQKEHGTFDRTCTGIFRTLPKLSVYWKVNPPLIEVRPHNCRTAAPFSQGRTIIRGLPDSFH